MEQLLGWLAVNSTFVYALLFAYCFGKSGALPFFAGVVAATGTLELQKVVLVVFAGGYLGDELRFFLGRRFGHLIRPKTERWQKALATTKALLEKYGAGYIFMYRYPKGMRTIGSFPVGMTTMPWMRFTAFNAGSAGLWASLLVGGGYVLGDQVVEMVENGYGVVSLLLLVVFGLAGWLAARRLQVNFKA